MTFSLKNGMAAMAVLDRDSIRLTARIVATLNVKVAGQLEKKSLSVSHWTRVGMNLGEMIKLGYQDGTDLFMP